MNIRGFARLFAFVLVAVAFIPFANAQQQPERAQAQAEREATQPGNNAPFWKDVQAGRLGSTQVETIEASNLINRGGQVWRSIHEGQLRIWAAVWLLGVPVLILLFYLIVGPQRLHEPPSGRWIRRFAAWERTVHWTVTIAFVILALTGLTLYFGKYYLAVLLTYPIYSWVAKICVSLHNFTAPVFAIFLVLMLVNFVSRNLPRSWDWTWLKHGGGLVGDKREPPAGFFNAGEKIWFWLGPCLLGLVMIGSGVVLLFPVYNQTRDVLATADIVHLLGALAFVGLAFGHIYMGTIGQIGAYRAMRKGLVDEVWAKEHHALWYEDLKEGRAAQASDAPLLTPRATIGRPRHAP